MYTSRISSKGQITIPVKLRNAINAGTGDLIGYELQDDTLCLKKIAPFDSVYHTAIAETLDEWNSPEDEEAFNDL